MSWIMVDVEADGQIPGDYSMIAFGAVVVRPPLDKTFSAHLMPISDKWNPDALSVSGFTREETIYFEEPKKVMRDFYAWLYKEAGTRPMFISDNNGFDWQFINYYFWHFLNKNPFGHSSTNLGSLYKGVVRNVHRNFKHLRKTRHDHDPVNDAKGNAEALIAMVDKFTLKMELK